MEINDMTKLMIFTLQEAGKWIQSSKAKLVKNKNDFTEHMKTENVGENVVDELVVPHSYAGNTPPPQMILVYFFIPSREEFIGYFRYQE